MNESVVEIGKTSVSKTEADGSSPFPLANHFKRAMARIIADGVLIIIDDTFGRHKYGVRTVGMKDGDII